MCACLPRRELLALLLSLPLSALACGEGLSVVPQPEVPVQQLWLLRAHARDAGTPATLRLSARQEPWLALEDGQALQLPTPAAAVHEAEGRRWLALGAVPGLDYRIDPCQQALALDLSGVARPAQQIDFSRTPSLAPPFAEPGGHLNLDLQWRHGKGLAPLAGLADAGFFSALGVLQNTLLADGRRWARLETSFTRDSPEQMTRLTVGDVLSRGAAFSRVLRMGGLQWGTDFSLQPELITAPQPHLAASAALPSKLEVYLNQLLQEQRAVDAGPFDLNQLPVGAGLNQIDVVVQDELGRREVLSLPFYSAPNLLKPGLSDYSLQFGWLREDYGSSRLGRYAQPAFLGRWRNGLRGGQTFEFGAELAQDQQSAGAGLSALWRDFGVWSSSVALSQSTAENGSHHIGGWMSAGFERQLYRWSFSLRSELGSARFARLGEAPGSLLRAQQAHLGWSLPGGGVVSLSYLRQTRRDSGDSAASTAGFSKRLSRDWQLSATATALRGTPDENLFSLSLSRRFGARTGLNLQQDSAGGLQRQSAWLQQDAGSELGLSWRAGVEQGDLERESAGLRYVAGPATLTADADRLAGNSYLRGGLATGWVWLGPDRFWTRPAGESFAVVDTGLPDVALRQDLRTAGRTDARGLLLLPRLRPYQRNPVSVDEEVLPMELGSNLLPQTAVPRAGGGVRLRFALAPAAPAQTLLRLDGTPVPAGAALAFQGVPLELPVGYEGVVLMPEGEGELRAEWPEGHCTAQWQGGRLSACTAVPP